MNNQQDVCPCGSLQNYQQCCGPYLTGEDHPPTPEALMRSRYTAFVLKDIAYIKNTMKGKALQKADLDQTKLWLDQVNWDSLSVAIA